MKMLFFTRQALEDTFLNEASLTAEFENVEADEFKPDGAKAASLFSFILGIDQHPKPMLRSEIESLGDFFTQRILLNDKNPLTLLELIDDISNLKGDDNLAIRKMFLVAEGGQHHLNNPSFEMNARLVFTWQKNNSTPPDLLLSTVPALNSTSSLLQVIAWSSKDNAFHFFERKHGAWGWAGNSFHALNPASRGKGPFDSHINGGLVMKELKFPWAHWHSQSSSISRANFAKDSEFNTHPVFSISNGAEELEAIVKTGIRRWTQSRIRADIKNGQFENFQAYFRQVLTPTSVNLSSSSTEFRRAEKNILGLPTTFFMDLDGLEFAATSIDLLTEAIPGGKLELNGDLYKKQALALNMHIATDEGVSLKGDTHFCFLVPERAFEDLEVVRQLVENGFLSARILLCLLMVDFPNPVESEKRASLLKYCPQFINSQNRISDFDDSWIAAIRASDLIAGSPEEEFLSYWNDQDLLGRVSASLHLFFDNVQRNLGNPEYVSRLIQLGEYRKNFYRVRRFDDLDEFQSTTSRTDPDQQKWLIDKEGNINNA